MRALLCMLGLCLGLGLAATPVKGSGLRDLYFGEALYHAYQGQYFDALRRLESAPREQQASDTVAAEDEASRARAAAVEGLDTAARTAEALSTLAQAEQRGFLAPQKFAVEDLVDDVIAQASVLADRRWHLDARGGGSIVADRAQGLLDGRVPYSVLPGNHDGIKGKTVLYNKCCWTFFNRFLTLGFIHPVMDIDQAEAVIKL